MIYRIPLVAILFSLLTLQLVLAEKKIIATDLATAFNPSEVRLLDSWLGACEKINADFLHRLDADRLLHNFRVNAGIPSSAKNLDGWEHPTVGLRGHFVGHYLSASASAVANNGDTLLLNRLNYMVDVLAQCQQKMGGKYLSAFPETDFDRLETQAGFVWAPYYTYHKIMQGLLDVYVFTHNKQAYTLVLNMADYVQARMAKLTPDAIDKMLYTPNANPLNEAGAMNDVLHQLYAISKNTEHLKLAQLFDRDWFKNPLVNGVDILAGLHSNTHIVLVNGFAQRYENTNEVEFKKATENFWEILTHHHCYANGSSSGPRPIPTTPTAMKGEHWGLPDRLSTTLTDEIAESCVTHNHQKLTAKLFSWTTDPRYADTYMNTFYNAVLPTQNIDNGTVVYHLPLSSPRQKKYLSEGDFRCCNGTGIEAFTHLNSNIYFHNVNKLWLNQYIPSELDWTQKGVKLIQTTDFPNTTNSTITIKCEKPTTFALNLFVPAWSTSAPLVKLNGKPLKIKAKPSSYITIEKEWSATDRIEIDFKFNFRVEKMKDNANVIALFYGPMMLAFQTSDEIILKGTTDEIVKSLLKMDGEMAFILSNNRQNYKLIPFYKVNAGSYGVYASIRNEY